MLEILIYGTIISAVYALLAVGFSLIFSVARVINLAQGSFYVLGAYLTYILATLAGLPLWFVIPVSLGLVVVLGLLVERFVVRRMPNSQMGVLMITLALSMMTEQALTVIFTHEARNVPAIIDMPFDIAGTMVSGQRLLTVGVAGLLIAALCFLIYRTRLGNAIRAVALDREAAAYVGIPPDRLMAFVWGLAAFLAAAAGVLTAPFLSVQPGMGLMPMIKSFVVVILGGLGSIPGSIVAAFLLGFTETVVAMKISPIWTEIVSVAAVFVILIVRPAGLFGKRAFF